MVAQVERAEPKRDPAKPLAGRMGIRGMRVGRANDLGEQMQSRILEPILFQDGVELHVLAVMSQFASFHIEWDRAQLARLALHLFRRDEDKLGLRVNELLEQPRARHPVNFHLFTGYPLHSFSLRRVQGASNSHSKPGGWPRCCEPCSPPAPVHLSPVAYTWISASRPLRCGTPRQNLPRSLEKKLVRAPPRVGSRTIRG